MGGPENLTADKRGRSPIRQMSVNCPDLFQQRRCGIIELPRRFQGSDGAICFGAINNLRLSA
jgi:hypothetical protein